MSALRDRAMRWLALGYLAAALVLGGASAAGYPANYALQLVGALLIAASMWRDGGAGHRSGLGPWAMAVALLALVQFVPLPPAIWVHLPGRDRVAAGFDLLGMPRPWLTLSLSPWRSLATLAWAIPAAAVFVVMRGRHAPDWHSAARLVVVLALGSVLLGLAQQLGGGPYPYAITNYGLGPGLFANSNHQSSFLLMALALGTGAVCPVPARWDRRVMAAVCGGVLVIGVLANRSLACMALLPVEVIALVALVRPDLRRAIVVGLPLLALAAIGLAVFGPIANDLTGHGAVPGISRHDFLVNGIRILRDHGALGTGLGSFPDIYRWYEDPALAGPTFVNHAHDDLLELLIETGVFGVLAIIAFLGWFVPRAVGLWRARAGDPMAQAATIAVAVALVHSLADYPLRTAALSCLFALCCAMIAQS